ncbi:MAG TPA: DUF2314 domain-containing protein [Telluria sp.]|jgi:uncharacterized protein YegJ (DUF2314 family)
MVSAFRTFHIAVLGAALCLLPACERFTGGDKVFDAANGDQNMVEAIRQARATLDTFLAAAAAPPAGTEGFKLKIALHEGELTEHFWVTPFRVTEDGFEGTLASEPSVLKLVKSGQRVHFTRAEVADWGYRKNGHQVGSYTMCAKLKTMPKAEADFYRNNSGFDC